MNQTTQQSDKDDIEYYPRLKRAPYIYDSDYGLVRRTAAHAGSIETDVRVPLNDEDGASINKTPHKSCSNLQNSPAMRRHSSLLKVFSSLGMSPSLPEQAEESADAAAATNPLLLSKSRRGSSVDIHSIKTDRDKSTTITGHKYPQWALHDPSTIVIQNGQPLTVGTLTLLHHHSLLSKQNTSPLTIPTWRLKERMKTVSVALILALNIGTDPPGLNKPTPSAKLLCWLDPTSVSRAKAKERIGERLEQQYAKWQQRAKLKYRRAIDPTVEVVKDLCIRMRESSKSERVLLHYNGHGVPRPTANGEIWLFDRHHTNYIPASVLDLRRWIGKPSIVVLDCSGGGVLMPYFKEALDGDLPTSASGAGGGTLFHRNSSSATMDESNNDGNEEYQAIRDTIVLCPTSPGEWLPLNPEYPADIFTSCLTTPIPMALRWFVVQNGLSMNKVDLEAVMSVPGKLTDRKTPLGELNWIFTAVTDTIAWNVLPSPLFQRLFRQDLLVASMFRNFLLAERILRSLGCTPMSNPEIPSTCNHSLWDAWDLAVETCLYQLVDQGYLRKSSCAPVTPEEEGDDNTASAPEAQPVNTSLATDAPFFGEQLTSFEIWLEYANTKPKSKLVIRSPPSSGTPLPYLWNPEGKTINPHEMDPPVELPIVLQVLLSQAHRVRALVLLKRFLELGPSAVNLALSVGIFPYVLKLLQSPIDEYRHVLVAIWARIISFDESCQVDVVKDRALPHFIRHLNWGLAPPKGSAPTRDARFEEDACEQRTMAAFILSVICSEYTLGQSECINEKLHLACRSLLQPLESEDEEERHKAERVLSPSFRTWICICVGNLTKDNPAAQLEVVSSDVHHRLLSRLNDTTSDVRAASCYALACLIGSAPIHPIASLSESQPPRPPQELSSTIQNMTRGVPGPFNPSQTLPPNTFTPSFSNAPQQTFGLGLQPYPMSNPGLGMNYLAPGNEQPTLFSASMTAVPPQPEIRTVFDDQQRMSADVQMGIGLAEVLDDACPVVRFEAVLALNRLIIKYVDGFIAVAGENLGGSSQRTVMSGLNPSISLPNGMDSEAEQKFSTIWSAVVQHYRCELQPSVRSLLSSIVRSVNERVMSVHSKHRLQRKSTRRQSMFSPTTEEGESNNGGDDSMFSFQPLSASRNTTGLNLSSYIYGSPQSIKRSGSVGIGMTIGTPPKALPDPNLSSKISQSSTALKFDLAIDDPCPESMFYKWKKVEFADRSVNVRQRLDLLSDIGAIKKYRMTRNSLVQQKGQLLKDSFAILAQTPKPPPDSPYATDVPSQVDKEIDARKEVTHLKQMSVIQNSSTRGNTSLLRFHSYEPALVVCGSSDVTCWNAESAERMVSFSNENPKNTRMTAATWINETTTSLFLTGSSDGSVRIYDGVFEPNDEMSKEKPTLVSSFFGVPDISVEKGSTGLILEYQSCGGQLIAGGSTKQIRCWDIASEKCRDSFDTGSEAMLTTLESAWKHSYRDGYCGLGPAIVVAGFSNGALKLFDTRAKNGSPTMDIAESRNNAGRRRIKYSEFDEHSSWIIDVSFTSFAGRHEVISGDVSGNIKYWDIRFSSSTRTLNHKMLMTALTVHSNIPMFATGSPAQFIKMVSYDGTTQQVIRYHEKIPGQRIGPVSCLSFHPQMPYLAAGFSDDVVSVYAPKDSD